MTENISLLTKKLLDTKMVTISGTKHQIIGMARYATLNNPAEEYIKISFSDGGGMYYPLNDDIAFVFDKKIDITGEIDLTTIGNTSTLFYKNETYTLVNGNDYQFVKEFYVGTIRELEGEVRFSDYEDENGNVLSIGTTVCDGKRADVLAQAVELSAFQ